MKDDHLNMESDEIERTAIEAAWERSAAPPLRDVLKREHDEAQKRPRNEALEKWGSMFEEAIERDLVRMRKTAKHLDSHSTPTHLPEMDGPDLDME